MLSLIDLSDAVIQPACIAADICCEVRSVYRKKALNGQFTGVRSPYGYMKSPEDKVFKRISEERYSAMSASLEKEEMQLKERYNKINDDLSLHTQQSRPAQDFADLIEQYSPITELDAVLLNTLIEKIIIHEHTDEDGNKEMPIEIYYRFIGNVGTAVN